MFKEQKIDADEFYNPAFYNFATYEIIKEYYPFIGEVISALNSIEDVLNEFIIDLIDIDNDKGWVIISDLPYSGKIKLWKRLIQYTLHIIEVKDKAEILTEVKSLVNDLTKVGEMRNKVAHANWESLTDKLFVHSGTKITDTGITHHYFSVDSEEFDKIIEEFERVEARLLKLEHRFSSDEFDHLIANAGHGQLNKDQEMR